MNLKYIVLLIFSGIFSGLILFQTMGPDGSVMVTMVAICALMLPFLFIWRELGRDILVAILTLTLPFNIDQTLNLDTTHVGGAKGFIVSVNGIAIVLLYFLWFIENYQNKKEKRKKFHISMIPLLGILLMCLLSLSNAPNRLLGIYEIMEFLKMILIFFYIMNYVKEKRRFHQVLIFLLTGLFLESMIVILQKASGTTLNLKILGSAENTSMQDIGGGSVFRAGGTLGGANALAWYLDYVLPICFSFLFFKLKTLLRRTLWVTFSMGILALIITLSRGGWLGFFIGILFIGLFQIRRFSIIKRSFLIIFFILISGFITVMILKTDNPIQKRLTSDDRGSAYVRLPLMRVAYRMIKAKLFFGNGVNNYVLVHHQYDDTPEQVTIHFPYPVHNFYLQTAVEIGVPGLLFLLWFIGIVFYCSLKTMSISDRFDQLFLTGAVAGILAALFQGLVENCSIGAYHLLPLWFISGIAIGRVRSYEEIDAFPESFRCNENS